MNGLEVNDLFLAAWITHPLTLTDCSRFAWIKSHKKMALLRAIKPNLAWFEYRIELVLRYYTKGGNYISFKPSSKIEAKVHLVEEGAQIQKFITLFRGPGRHGCMGVKS